MALANRDPMPNPGKGKTSPHALSARNDATMRQNAPHRGATHQYQRAQVESASPTRLIVLLYEGAIRFCSLAQDAMQRGDLEGQNLNLIRAQRIIGELLACLNRTAGGEVALNLARIYTHLLAELVRANLYDDTEAVRHVISLLTDMRGSCIEIDRQQSGESDGQNSSSPDDPGNVRQPGQPSVSREEAHTIRPAHRSGHSPAVRKTVPAVPLRLEDRLA